MSEANRGFGSAALMSYPPLGGYLVGATSLLTGDVVTAFHLVLLSMTALSGVAFYACARSFAPPLASSLAAALYLVAPYRMIDLHARFAFAEVLAFIWLPLLVKFLLDLRERPGLAAWTGLVVASTGLLYTHVLSAFMFLVAVGPLVLCIVVRDRRWRALVGLGLAGLATAAFSAAYLLPLLVERGLTHTEYLTGAWWGDWRANFLFTDPAGVGAQTSPIRPLVELSFWYGVVVVVLSGILVARSRDRQARILVAASLIAILLQLSISGVIWRLVPGMEVLQFPWRFQTLLVLFSCLLIARATVEIRWDSGLLIGIAATWAFVFAVFLWGAISYDVTSESLEEIQISQLVFKEHIPRGVQDWERFERLPLAGDGLLATSPRAEVAVLEWSSHRRRIDIAAEELTEVVLRTFYFPGWEATIDGEPAPMSPVAPLYAIGLQVPPGDHQLDIRFGPTPIRVVGSVLSILAAGLLLIANLRRCRRRV